MNPSAVGRQQVVSRYGAELEFLSVGSGEPITLFAHGLAGTIADTRPLAGGVAGCRVFPQLRGHGGSVAPDGAWTYADLADDLGTVADEVGATRALGVSLGAGALCRLLAGHPDRFERLVFFLPASVDRPVRLPDRLTTLAAAARAGDAARVEEILTAEIPADLRATATARSFVAARTAALVGNPVAGCLGGLAGEAALPEGAAGLATLQEVRAPALVVAGTDDPLHPLEVAERLADTLPYATLRVFPGPGVLWRHRTAVRELISTFLNS